MNDKVSPPVLTSLGQNMIHWNALKATDPKYTKKVEFGRKFTSINSQWQLQRMTEQFGPVGEGWGYRVAHDIARISDDYVLAIADVTIWRTSPENITAFYEYGPVRGMSPIVEKGKNGLHFDDDAGKKAMTDALTKGLSHLGLSADVFLGLFDDNKYVQKVAEQFRESPRASGEELVRQTMERATMGAFKESPIEAVDPADRGLVQGGGEQSQYEVNKRKEAEAFVKKALETFATMQGSGAIADWYRTPISPKGKSTNVDAVDRLNETFPDLGEKLETAADEVRLRTGARLQ